METPPGNPPETTGRSGPPDTAAAPAPGSSLLDRDGVVPEALPRCGKCRNLLDPEDLYCPNCGHEAPGGEEDSAAERFEVHRFDCRGCGATLTWTVEAQNLECSFCGRRTLERRPDARPVEPRLIVPFRLDRAAAEARFREWLGRGWFRPSDLRRTSRMTEQRGVYLPWWLFEARATIHWTADSDERPWHASADWAPHAGTDVEHRFRNLLVPASGALTWQEIQAMGGYHLEAAEPFHRDAPGDLPMEAFRVGRARARQAAEEQLQHRAVAVCEPLVPGRRTRNVHANPLVTDRRSAPLLLPAWIVAYEYRGTVYRWVANGQTGEHVGKAPLSLWKILLIPAALGAVVLLLFVFLLIAILLEGG